MLLSSTLIKKIRPRSLAIAPAVLLLTLSLYFFKAHWPFQLLRSRPIESTRAGTTSLRKSAPSEPTLHVTSIVQHGHIIEIKGTTEPGAVIMINGQRAATIFDGNSFRHFVGPLPAGASIVSITCQNDDGGVNTQQLAVTLE